jgi:hypothetical protein
VNRRTSIGAAGSLTAGAGAAATPPSDQATAIQRDYLLLVNGELLDADADVATMPALDSSYHRNDAFDFRSVTRHENTGYTVYFLTSEIKDQRGNVDLEWLER